MSNDLADMRAWVDTLETADTGLTPAEEAAEQALRDYAERTLPTIPDVTPCQNDCGTLVTSAFGPHVAGLADGIPVHLGRHAEAFVCADCAELLAEAGWTSW